MNIIKVDIDTGEVFIVKAAILHQLPKWPLNCNLIKNYLFSGKQKLIIQ